MNQLVPPAQATTTRTFAQLLSWPCSKPDGRTQDRGKGSYAGRHRSGASPCRLPNPPFVLPKTAIGVSRMRDHLMT
jgi:hypothetical protein